MAQNAKRNRPQGKTAVSYKGAKYDASKIRRAPAATMATGDEIDAILATPEGQEAAATAELAAEEARQNIWDWFANQAVDQYEAELRERRFYNAMYADGSPASRRRRDRWVASMRYPPSYPPM